MAVEIVQMGAQGRFLHMDSLKMTSLRSVEDLEVTAVVVGVENFVAAAWAFEKRRIGLDYILGGPVEGDRGSRIVIEAALEGFERRGPDGNG